MDFQFFCTIRDKDDYILGENDVYPCSICKKQYHNKFQCSRLHYLPFSRQIIAKNIQKEKLSRLKKTDKDRKFPSCFFDAIKTKKKNDEAAFRYLQSNLKAKQY